MENYNYSTPSVLDNKQESDYESDGVMNTDLKRGPLSQISIADLLREADMVNLQERVEKLEKRPEQKSYIVPLQNLDSDKLKLRMPLGVTVGPNNQKGFAVWSEDLNAWGEGKSEEEAKENFLRNVEELYFDLKKDKDKLGPALKKTWVFMQKIMEEV